VKELNDKMVAETGKLAVAAKSGNLDQLKAAFGPAAQTCKACQDRCITGSTPDARPWPMRSNRPRR